MHLKRRVSDMNPDDAQRKLADGAQEIERLSTMVLAWKESWASSAKESGGGDFLCDEFREEIDRMVMPYLRRLLETQHVWDVQVRDFLEFCSRQVDELNARIQKET